MSVDDGNVVASLLCREGDRGRNFFEMILFLMIVCEKNRRKRERRIRGIQFFLEINGFWKLEARRAKFSSSIKCGRTFWRAEKNGG